MVRRAQEMAPEQLEQIVTRLKEARTQPNVELLFKDGRRFHGAITFVERLGTGRLINVDQEFSMEFNIHDLTQVDY